MPHQMPKRIMHGSGALWGATCREASSCTSTLRHLKDYPEVSIATRGSAARVAGFRGRTYQPLCRRLRLRAAAPAPWAPALKILRVPHAPSRGRIVKCCYSTHGGRLEDTSGDPTVSLFVGLMYPNNTQTPTPKNVISIYIYLYIYIYTYIGKNLVHRHEN